MADSKLQPEDFQALGRRFAQTLIAPGIDRSWLAEIVALAAQEGARTEAFLQHLAASDLVRSPTGECNGSGDRAGWSRQNLRWECQQCLQPGVEGERLPSHASLRVRGERR